MYIFRYGLSYIQDNDQDMIYFVNFYPAACCKSFNLGLSTKLFIIIDAINLWSEDMGCNSSPI